MVLDPNWGTNLFRTYLSGRQSRQQEAEAADERELRGLQRQQITSGMARQVKQDAANEALASDFETMAAPIAPPRPTKIAPDAMAGGTPPGVRIQPSLKGRPGVREAIPSALNKAVEKKLADHPDFNTVYAPPPPVAGSRLGKMARAGYFGEAMRLQEADRLRQYEAPIKALEAEEAWRKSRFDEEKGRHSMKHQDDTLAATRANQSADASWRKTEQGLRQQQGERDQARLDAELNGPSPMKMFKSGVAEAGSTLLKGIVDTGRDIVGRGYLEGVKNQGRQSLETDRAKNREEYGKNRDAARAAQGEADRKNRMAIAANNAKAALDRELGSQRSAQLIAEARNKVQIAIANAQRMGVDAREAYREQMSIIRSLVREHGVDEESAALAADLGFDDAWFGRGSLTGKVAKPSGPPIDPNVGAVAPTAGQADASAIQAEKARRAAARAAARGAPIQ